MLVTMDNIDTLVQRLRDGDDSVFDEIINLYIPLARRLAQRFVRRFPERRNDLRQVAMLGLVQAVNSAPGKLYNNNIGAWINTRVVGALRDYLAKDHMIPVPKDEWSKMVKSYKLDELRDRDLINALIRLKGRYLVFQASMQLPGGDFVEDFVTSDRGRAVARDDPNPFRCKEIMGMLELTAYERLIIKLRMQSYTLQEIGNFMDCTHSVVLKDLVKIQERYLRLRRRNPSLPGPPV